MLGGTPEPSLSAEPSLAATSYSVVSPSAACVLGIPPLPRPMPHHPLAGHLHGHLLTCYRDYWPYRQHQHADHQCWAMDLDRLDKQWTSLPTSHSLVLSSCGRG